MVSDAEVVNQLDCKKTMFGSVRRPAPAPSCLPPVPPRPLACPACPDLWQEQEQDWSPAGRRRRAEAGVKRPRQAVIGGRQAGGWWRGEEEGGKMVRLFLLVIRGDVGSSLLKITKYYLQKKKLVGTKLFSQ